MKLRIVNKSNNPLPEYKTEGSAGMDLAADLKETIVIESREQILVPTGLYVEVPEGYEAQIRPRSSLALKKGLTIPNAPGTIDCDYRGEIKVILFNNSDMPRTIEPGERIAQMVIAKYEKVELELVEVLNETIRNEGGFGSTGK